MNGMKSFLIMPAGGHQDYSLHTATFHYDAVLGKDGRK